MGDIPQMWEWYARYAELTQSSPTEDPMTNFVQLTVEDDLVKPVSQCSTSPQPLLILA